MEQKKTNTLKNIHASAIIIHGQGVLLRGESGAGKSLLALQLLEIFSNNSILIADDRVDIFIENNDVFMQTPKNIAGLIELCGHGIVKKKYQKKAKLNLIVDLIDEVARYPEQKEFISIFEGVKIPRCPIPKRQKTDSAHQILLIKAALRLL